MVYPAKRKGNEHRMRRRRRWHLSKDWAEHAEISSLIIIQALILLIIKLLVINEKLYNDECCIIVLRMLYNFIQATYNSNYINVILFL